MATKNSRHDTRRIDDLELHELLDLISEEPDEAPLQSMMERLETDRDQARLEILVDNRVIHDVLTFRAAQSLKLKSIPVSVRNDLEGLDPAVVGLHIIARDLDLGSNGGKLEAARRYAQWQVWASGIPRRRSRLVRAEDLRVQTQSLLGISRRELERLARIDQANHAIRQAFAHGKLPLTAAQMVCSLPQANRKEIASLIGAGEEPMKVVRRFLPARSTRHRSASQAVASFVTHLDRGLMDLEGRVDEIGILRDHEIQVLRATQEVIPRLLEIGTRAPGVPMEELIAEARVIGVRRAARR